MKHWAIWLTGIVVIYGTILWMGAIDTGLLLVGEESISEWLRRYPVVFWVPWVLLQGALFWLAWHIGFGDGPRFPR